MKKNKRNHKTLCTHPKNKIAKYRDEKTNTYYEHCIKCGKTIYTRKFVEGIK